LHAGVRIARAALACAAAVAVGLVLLSGGSGSDPSTPPALPGLPSPFLGTAVTGDGGLTAAVDAYGDVVDLRAPGPAGMALIDNPSDRQAAGTVPADTGIVPRVRIGGGSALPMWRAESAAQHYLTGTNVVRTVTRFGGAQMVVTAAASGEGLALTVSAGAGAADPRSGRDAEGAASGRAVPSVSVNVASGVHCARESRAGQLDLLCRVGRAVPSVSGAAAGDVARACAAVIQSAVRGGRRWLSRSQPFGSAAPKWAQSMYRRSLLTIHALTSRATGAVAAGARDGWAYVWPRDAATAALALAASGHRAEARHVARFLTGLDLSAAARFDEHGAPIPGRAAQGDAAGWVTVAARATGVPAPPRPFAWRDRADYQESSPGTYLGNALAAAGARSSAAEVGAVREIGREFGAAHGLVREAGDPGSGLDSAAGWAVRPFGLTALYPAAERTLLRLVRQGTRYGITPGEGWKGGEDPWMAPTAWSAWALAALASEAHSHPSAARAAALTLLTDLRRAATPTGDLPERVGAHTWIPTSTTPLLWSSAFAILALRELWP
jgi:Glycosyl hydrolases family 15